MRWKVEMTSTEQNTIKTYNNLVCQKKLQMQTKFRHQLSDQNASCCTAIAVHCSNSVHDSGPTIFAACILTILCSAYRCIPQQSSCAPLILFVLLAFLICSVWFSSKHFSPQNFVCIKFNWMRYMKCMKRTCWLKQQRKLQHFSMKILNSFVSLKYCSWVRKFNATKCKKKSALRWSNCATFLLSEVNFLVLLLLLFGFRTRLYWIMNFQRNVYSLSFSCSPHAPIRKCLLFSHGKPSVSECIHGVCYTIFIDWNAETCFILVQSFFSFLFVLVYWVIVVAIHCSRVSPGLTDFSSAFISQQQQRQLNRGAGFFISLSELHCFRFACT